MLILPCFHFGLIKLMLLSCSNFWQRLSVAEHFVSFGDLRWSNGTIGRRILSVHILKVSFALLGILHLVEVQVLDLVHSYLVSDRFDVD